MIKIIIVSERDLLQLTKDVLYNSNKISFKLFKDFYKSQYNSLTNLFELLFTNFSRCFIKINSEYNNLYIDEYYKIINIFNNILKNINIDKIYTVNILDLFYNNIASDLNTKIDSIFYNNLYEFIDKNLINNKDIIFENLIYIIDNLYSYIESHLIHLDNDLDYLNKHYIYIDNLDNNLIFIMISE